MSIKDIAEKVGVSSSTVSRVLNNPQHKCSSKELRDKIWKVAIEMNYTPNQAARNLKLGKAEEKSKVYYINVLVTRMDEQQNDPFYTELLKVIESEIHKRGCILSTIWYKSFFSNNSKCQRMDLDHKISEMYKETEDKNDGLIIIGKCNKEALKHWGKKYKNIVCVNRNAINYDIDEVFCDGRKIATMAVEYLIQLGHTDIGYVGEYHDESRYKGFLEVLCKHDIDVDPNWIIGTRPTEADGYEAMKKIFNMEYAPTAIYCANDIIAVGMLKCINKHKRRFYTPSIISSDDIDEAQNTNPMLTTICLPKEEMGRFAVSLLIGRIEGLYKCTAKVEMSGQLIIRSSCTSPGNSYWNYYI